MEEDGLLDRYDGYLVFDADNLLEKSYIREMNRTFCDGYQIITSCRNAKNFGTNWLTASYGLWFLHEAQWIKGYQQVFSKYGKEIFGSIRHGIKTGFACFDMTMYTWPALFITIFMVASNLVLLAVSLITGQDVGIRFPKWGVIFWLPIFW